jgi:hypothetical protein
LISVGKGLSRRGSAAILTESNFDFDRSYTIEDETAVLGLARFLAPTGAKPVTKTPALG